METKTLTTEHILNQLSVDLGVHIASSRTDTMKKLLEGNHFVFHLAITTDVVETEYDFRTRYGHGYSYNFSLSCYEQGKELAAQLYWIFYKNMPDMSRHTGACFPRNEFLYLFLHIQKLHIAAPVLLPDSHYEVIRTQIPQFI